MSGFSGGYEGGVWVGVGSGGLGCTWKREASGGGVERREGVCGLGLTEGMTGGGVRWCAAWGWRGGAGARRLVGVGICIGDGEGLRCFGGLNEVCGAGYQGRDGQLRWGHSGGSRLGMEWVGGSKRRQICNWGGGVVWVCGERGYCVEVGSRWGLWGVFWVWVVRGCMSVREGRGEWVGVSEGREDALDKAVWLDLLLFLDLPKMLVPPHIEFDHLLELVPATLYP
ncbi:hypothetical protein Tco_1101454 [Tanacetum coccineum]